MRRIVLLAVCVISSFKLWAQDTPITEHRGWEIKQLYVSLGAGQASDLKNEHATTPGFNIWLTFYNRWGVDIGFRGWEYKAHNTPADFIGDSWVGPDPGPLVYNRLQMFNVVYRKKSSQRHVKLVLEAGLGYYMQENKDFTKHIDTSTGWFSGYWGDNYDSKTHTSYSIGLVNRADLEFPFTGAFGVNLSMYSFVYDKGVFVGTDIMILLGRVCPHHRQHKNRR
ncbi:MAG: hypothetical protein H0X33_03350 [Taibaiella sp.]|nr:hypothetical protein [Taibaiella sp.]